VAVAPDFLVHGGDPAGGPLERSVMGTGAEVATRRRGSGVCDAL